MILTHVFLFAGHGALVNHVSTTRGSAHAAIWDESFARGASYICS